MARKLIIGGAAALALLLILAVGAAMVIDVDQFRPALEREFQSTLGRKVTLGKISLSVLGGNVSVDNVSIADDSKFSNSPFVTTKAVKIAVEVWPLLVSRSLNVKSFTLEEPHILLRRSAAGAWNFSTIGAEPSVKAPDSSAANNQGAPAVTVGKLTISRGQVTVVSPGARAKERIYTDVNLEARDLSYTSQFPFRLDARTPGGGSVHMEGKAGPLDANDASATPLDATVQVKQVDLAATGFVDPASGLAGIVDFTGSLVSNGREATSKGTLSASKLQLVQGSSPSRVPMTVDYQTKYDLKRRSGTLEQGNVHIGKALARLSGTFKSDDQSTNVRMKISGHQMPVPELEASLPALGVTLPAGASLDGGTLDLDLDVTGPVDRLVTTGPIKMSNTKVKGFDLGSNLAVIAAFAGVPKSAETVIQTLSSNVRVAPDGIRADTLELVVPSIGRLSGAGTIAPKGALDFKMLAQLAASSGIAGDVSRITSLGRPENGTPFLVSGTTASPRFAPDLAAAARGLVNKDNATKAASGVLKGIFGKKPK